MTPDLDFPQTSAAFSGLPRPFLEAMKTLFEVMDKEKKGWIQIEDIAEKWRPAAENSEHLPKDILGSLSKVAGKDGHLTFERFCAGLKIAILRHEADRNRLSGSRDFQTSHVSSPVFDESSSSSASRPRPSPNSLNRTSSLPNLLGEKKQLSVLPVGAGNIVTAPSPAPSEPCTYVAGPPKPPRDPTRMSGIFSRPQVDGLYGSHQPPSLLGSAASHPPTWTGPATSSQSQLPPYSYNQSVGLGSANSVSSVGVRSSTRALKRRDSNHHRRHTLQGGVDVTMMKRLKEWEEEKMVLEEGLAALRMAQDWYLQRSALLQEKLKYGPGPGASGMNSEAVQERLMFELQSIRDLNQRVNRLAKIGRPGAFPSHINLELAQPSPQRISGPAEVKSEQLVTLERQVERLKIQNKMLTEEVGSKSNFITNLEQEKSLLIKQLFQARSARATQQQNFHNTQRLTKNETTFM